MFGLGMAEIVVIAIVALLVLGPEKLPEAAKKLSKGIRDFRRQTQELKNSVELDDDIGEAVRDLRSALRGDEWSADWKPPVGSASPARASVPLADKDEAGGPAEAAMLDPGGKEPDGAADAQPRPSAGEDAGSPQLTGPDPSADREGHG